MRVILIYFDVLNKILIKVALNLSGMYLIILFYSINTHRDNLNSTLGNLGWDGQSLEERSLLGSHT